MAHNRYDIQKKLKDVGNAGQEKIGNSRVAVIGLGGLGSPCSLYLAAAGVGKLYLVDGDRVEVSNLHRQILYEEKDVGLSKAKVASEKLKRLNSKIEIFSMDTFILPETLDSNLKDFDYIVDCTDQLEIRFWMSHYCQHHRKMYVYGSSDQWSGETALLVPDGPCLSCLFPDVESGLFQDCNTQGVLGPTVGIIGQLQAQLVLNHILFGAGENVLHLYHGQKIQFEKIKIQKRKNCRICQGDPCSFLDVKTDKISLSTLAEWQCQKKKIHLVDIRPDVMVRESPLPNSIHIPYAKILGEQALDLDPAVPVVLVCHRNLKSPLARYVLKEKGYKQVYLLEKGLTGLC